MNNAFFYRSPVGILRVEENNGALVLCAFADGTAETEPSLSVLSEAKDWLDRYFAGRDPGRTPPLAPQGTAFQKAVWEAIGRIPCGKTVSYGGLAVSMGLTPRHARAIGNALHKNPLLLFIPCHRAIGKDGSFTGFAAGIARKEALLRLERTKDPSALVSPNDTPGSASSAMCSHDPVSV